MEWFNDFNLIYFLISLRDTIFLSHFLSAETAETAETDETAETAETDETAETAKIIFWQMLGPRIEPVTVPAQSGDVTAMLPSLYVYLVTLCNIIIISL